MAATNTKDDGERVKNFKFTRNDAALDIGSRMIRVCTSSFEVMLVSNRISKQSDVWNFFNSRIACHACRFRLVVGTKKMK